MGIFRHTYLSSRFFIVITAMILWFCLAFFICAMMLPGIYLVILFSAVTLLDFMWLYSKKVLIQGNRTVPHMLSLSDDNQVSVLLRNLSSRFWHIEIVDELPEQLQVRDFNMKVALQAFGNEKVHYSIKPLSRGIYAFGALNIFAMSRLKLVRRRVQLPLEMEVKVYPSIIQMKKFELYTISRIARVHGIKKMRRIGLSYEFEQIKSYVRGDDVRQINWKSTGRNQQLMINQFEDEKSQPIYNIIDKSRIMLMPFNGLSLLDYAINASLVISNVALRKYDKAGLVTFSDRIGAAIKADRKHGQLLEILEALYNQKERDLESNYELLYFGIRNLVKTRSLIFLYTNFESMYGLKRVLPVLRNINKQHLLIVVFFENSELASLSQRKPTDLKGVYTQILAEQAINDKLAMAQELNNIGIQTILTRPEDLSLNTINKYLEIKSRGII
jgi:uncharacterized protein (DUF58 family)